VASSDTQPQALDAPLCPSGHRMRIYQVRIDLRRRTPAGRTVGWERAVSYDQWVCDTCRHREPPQPVKF